MSPGAGLYAFTGSTLQVQLFIATSLTISGEELIETETHIDTCIHLLGAELSQIIVK